MGFVVNKEPNDLVLVKNPIEYEFQLDNHIGAPAAKGVYSLVFKNNPEDTDDFTLFFGKYKLKFSGAPAQNAAQDKTGTLFTPGATRLDSYNSLLNTMTKNVLLNTYFKVTGHYQVFNSDYEVGFFLEQKIASEENKIEIDDPFDIFIITTQQIPVVQQRNLSYKMGVEIYFERTYGSGDYSMRANLPLAPSESGIVQLDIQRIARGVFKGNEELPKFNSGGWVATNLLRQIRIMVYEELDYQFGYQPLFQVQSLRLINGGVKFEDFPALRDFYTEWVDKGKFLSWRANNREVTENQPEFLAIYDFEPNTVNIAFGITGMIVKINWRDGTSNTYQLNNLDVKKHQIGVFQVGWSWIKNTLSLPDKIVDNYECVYVGATTGALSEWVKFTLVEEHYNDRFFVYQNSFGVFDTFRTIGALTEETETFKSESESAVPFNYSDNQHNMKFDSMGYLERYTVNTGPKTKIELQLLKDLINSDTVYLLNGTELVPIVIPQERYRFPDDSEGSYQYEMQFTFWGPKQLNYSRQNA